MRPRSRPALGEAEQRHARLGIPAPAVRSPKGLLRSGQVTPLSPQVAELVVRLRDDADVEVSELVADADDLALGFVPRSLYLE